MKVVIFGNGRFASLAWYCIAHDSPLEVAGFTVDAPYITDDSLHGLPVVDFSLVEDHFPPNLYGMFVHLGAAKGSTLRVDRYLAAKAKGYRMNTYVSSRALCWPDLRVGENCAIYEGTVIQPFASIGDNVIIRSQVHVSHHAIIGDHSFLAAGVCMGGASTIGARCFVGLNATIRDGISIADGCFIAAGAVVTADTERDGIYAGAPARKARSKIQKD